MPPLDSSLVLSATPVDALRRTMARHGVDAVIVPSSDPHLSEYLPARWQGRQWLTGFSGSAGTAVVTATFAGVWVDSRYWEQAERQLQGTGFALMRLGASDVPAQGPWLCEHLPAGAVVAIDGDVLGLKAFRDLQGALQAAGHRLATDLDLIGESWPDRPGLPHAPVSEHRPPEACVTRANKLGQVRRAMTGRNADLHLLSSLDDIAWLFNLRGADVDHNPVFLAYVLIQTQRATLYVSPGKIAAELATILERDGVDLAAYDAFPQALAGIAAGSRLLIDPARTTRGVVEKLRAGVELIEAVNPSTLAKSRKTDDELAFIRRTMEIDGAALCAFFAWLQANLGRSDITELTIDERLRAERARQPGFVCESFTTIAGFNANGAMPHYCATESSHARIEGSGLLLIDSGGQYLGGTTDITRVVAIGVPSPEQKTDFTLVLRGMIGLSRARFPEGIASGALDALARAPLWEAGADYGHGTGHGVGYFLNVHEGPQSISHRAPASAESAMRAGMVTSNEPGVYRPGRWGVRIENLVAARPWRNTECGAFLEFETLTLCPIDTGCIDLTLLRDDEIAWLNDYHATVRRRLSPLVEGAALDWLMAGTKPVTR